MGWLATCAQVTRDVLGLPRLVDLDLPPAETFDSPPRPIDQLIAAMYASGPGARVGRTEALSVAAVQRGRNALCSIATLPLRLYRGAEVMPSPLLAQLDPDVANVVTLAQTIEDLAFEGISWWKITAQDFAGFPVAVRHLDVGSVTLDPPKGQANPFPSGRDPRGVAIVWVAGVPTPADQLIRFDSPNPGLLVANARAIRRALLLDQLAAMYADNPRPLDYFTDGDDPNIDPMTDDQIDAFLADWSAGRKLRATGWIPGSAKRVDVNAPSPAELQLVELQRQVTLEIANGLGVDPEDLGVSTTSRTYFNAQDRRTSKINETYAPYMQAITQRLSMGDVTRRGHDVRFDLSDYLKPDPAAQAAYWKALKDMGVMDADEIRAAAGLSGRAPKPEPAPAPAVPTASAAATGQRFDGDRPSMTFARTDFGAAEAPKVDVETRTISGLALPYGKVAQKYGLKYRFKPGSLEWADATRVKSFMDHVSGVGVAKELTSGADGLSVKLGVLSGPDGSAKRLERDQLLYDAQNGLYDGLSVGVDFSLDPEDGDVVLGDDGVYDVQRATLREVSVTSMPAFDDARVTKVAASRQGGTMDPCQHCGQQHAPGVACATFAAAQPTLPTDPAPAPSPTPSPVPDMTQLFAQFMAAGQREIVDPTRGGRVLVVEPAPYRFDNEGNLRRGSHDFSTDIFAGWREGGGGDVAARDRANTFVSEAFSGFGERNNFAVTPANVATLNPNRNRPDLYVDQMEYQYPVWDAINKGTLQDITPFVVPKFSSSSGLVADHVTGTEPTPGAFAATSQTITPTAVSGKIEYTREAYDQGGNPQASGLIWRQMTRAYFEALEAYAVAQLVANAASMTDVTITTAAADSALDQALVTALVPLRFVRGGFRFRKVFTQVDLYTKLAAAKDSAGRPLYPSIGPMNAAGQQSDDFGVIHARGLDFLPAWATAATSVNASSSYMFDPEKVSGWATAPQRIDIQWRVAWVDIGLFGYKAFAITDFAGTRELVYDPV